MTRREIMLATPAALMAQPAVTPIPQNAEEEIKSASEQNLRNAAQLAKVPLPMSTEPAVHFKA